VLGFSDGAKVTAPLTEIAAALAEAADKAADEAVVAVLVPFDAAAPEDDVPVVVEFAVVEDVSVVVEFVVVDDVEAEVEAESEVLDELVPVLVVPVVVVPVVVLFDELTEIVQLWTSLTAGLPLASVIGVKVTTQVWVKGPAGVVALDTVITVVGAERPAVDVACRLLTGNASETFKNRRASRKRATNKRDNMADS